MKKTKEKQLKLSEQQLKLMMTQLEEACNLGYRALQGIKNTLSQVLLVREELEILFPEETPEALLKRIKSRKKKSK